MTSNSTENKEINYSPQGYNTVSDQAQDQTAILIENEQLRAENEAARAVLTAHRRQQEENKKCCSGPGARDTNQYIANININIDFSKTAISILNC